MLYKSSLAVTKSLQGVSKVKSSELSRESNMASEQQRTSTSPVAVVSLDSPVSSRTSRSGPSTVQKTTLSSWKRANGWLTHCEPAVATCGSPFTPALGTTPGRRPTTTLSSTSGFCNTGDSGCSGERLPAGVVRFRWGVFVSALTKLGWRSIIRSNDQKEKSQLV